jgi:hypothetical protein
MYTDTEIINKIPESLIQQHIYIQICICIYTHIDTYICIYINTYLGRCRGRKPKFANVSWIREANKKQMG